MLEPLRDSQGAAPAARCGRCGGEVYKNERMFRSDGKWLCIDCFRAEIESMLRSNPVFLADVLLMEHREV